MELSCLKQIFFNPIFVEAKLQAGYYRLLRNADSVILFYSYH